MPAASRRADDGLSCMPLPARAAAGQAAGGARGWAEGRAGHGLRAQLVGGGGISSAGACARSGLAGAGGRDQWHQQRERAQAATVPPRGGMMTTLRERLLGTVAASDAIEGSSLGVAVTTDHKSGSGLPSSASRASNGPARRHADAMATLDSRPRTIVPRRPELEPLGPIEPVPYTPLPAQQTVLDLVSRLPL